jgi:alkylated DNA repair dioxygenase AlkB
MKVLELPGGEALLDEGFLPPEDADRLFAALRREIPWENETITLFGREVPVPRLVSWHGDPGASYAYSGVRHQPKPWTPALRELEPRVEAAAEAAFNSVLANLYRSGADGMSWHADDERELGPEPVIASVSLGAPRVFRLKRRDGTAKLEVALPHGSLLIMRGGTQELWLHSVPKTAKPVGERINLTFRWIEG